MKTKRSLGRRMLFGAISTLLLIIIIFIVGEIGTRIMYAMKDVRVGKQEARPPYNTAEKESTIGWKTKTNYLYDGKMEDADKKAYDVHLTTDERGFRQYGNPETDKKKVFFLGDSYTQSVEVSDDKVFYKIIGDSLPIEVFAYGMAGYGQLQELMILEEFYDEIQPDILVLQVCSNDFIDNHHKLELESGYKVGLRRPYLTLTGETVYHHPVRQWEKVETYSRFLGFILKKWDNITQKLGTTESAEKKIAEQADTYEAFEYSLKVTEIALQKIVKKLGDKTQIIVFNADYYEPQNSKLKSICENNNILYTFNPMKAIKLKEHNGVTIRAGDGYHWNEAGHQTIATALIEDLKGLLK